MNLRITKPAKGGEKLDHLKVLFFASAIRPAELVKLSRSAD
jgi:hypothetical protein